jgi:hypothetical protein
MVDKISAASGNKDCHLQGNILEILSLIKAAIILFL